MLRRFSLSLFGRLPHLDSLPSEVVAAEGFTRFLLHRKHFAPTTGRVKAPALLPWHNNDKGRLETSIYRTDGLGPDHVWALGYRYVETPSGGRRIQARGSGVISSVTSQRLLLDVDGDPFPRHVDIVGWPLADEKHLQMMKATEIANGMRLEMDPRQTG